MGHHLPARLFLKHGGFFPTLLHRRRLTPCSALRGTGSVVRGPFSEFEYLTDVHSELRPNLGSRSNCTYLRTMYPHSVDFSLHSHLERILLKNQKKTLLFLLVAHRTSPAACSMRLSKTPTFLSRLTKHATPELIDQS